MCPHASLRATGRHAHLCHAEANEHVAGVVVVAVLIAVIVAVLGAVSRGGCFDFYCSPGCPPRGSAPWLALCEVKVEAPDVRVGFHVPRFLAVAPLVHLWLQPRQTSVGGGSQCCPRWRCSYAVGFLKSVTSTVMPACLASAQRNARVANVGSLVSRGSTWKERMKIPH